MGGFCGVYSKTDCVTDLFYGTDYHSHLGTHRGGMAVLGPEGFKRAIHSIANAPFRTRLQDDYQRFEGRLGLGVISDTDPQPLVISSPLGTYAIVTVGILTNQKALMDELWQKQRVCFDYSTTSGGVGPTAVVSRLINSQASFAEGFKYALEKIEGSCSIMLITESGDFWAARDKYGRTPVILGKKPGSMIVTMESSIFPNLGYTPYRELGPGEVVTLTPDGAETVIPPGREMAICSFLWVYYGYPASSYEGANVEESRYRSGRYLAHRSPVEADSVGGIPDSGSGHALGYSHESGLPYKRPFVKYTPTWPRSFMPPNQRDRDMIARMKLIPIPDLIRGQRLVFCDDSIVRGTQLKNQTNQLYADGAREVHMRIACPPLLFGCKFINFSRSKSVMDLITRRVIRELEGPAYEADPDAAVRKYLDPDGTPYKLMVERIRRHLGLTTLSFQRLDDLIASIGLPKERLCTYCWSGRDVSDRPCGGCCPGCGAGEGR